MKTALCLSVCVLLAGCAAPTVRHPGYAPDGYGVINNSTHIPPPDDLTHPAHQQ